MKSFVILKVLKDQYLLKILLYLIKKKINNLTEKIRNNLILLTQKCGFKNIMDGFSLILGEEKQIFLNNLEYKELNLVKFYNNVFIPISFDFYTMDLKKIMMLMI